MNQSCKKGLFYSQPALGIGQLTRSLNICKSLIKAFEIDFLLGAPGINQTVHSSRFHLHEMPPLWIQDWKNTQKLSDPFNKKSLAEIFELRRLYLMPFLKKFYDFIIIEIFPFSKWKFKQEIDSIIQHLKSVNPACLVFCSMRDICGKKNIEEQKLIVQEVKKSFDYIFIHADPAIIRFDETFEMASEIASQLIYTGYVANPEVFPSEHQRSHRILVSCGSGSYGSELPQAVIHAALFLKKYDFLFLLGPKAPFSLRQDLEKLKASARLANVQIAEFSADFYALLSKSCLSISLGGSTLIDIVKTETPALVYPLAHEEHVLRAEKFASKGFVRLLSMKDLLPENLILIMLKQMKTPFPKVSINLSGSENTLKELQNII